MQGQSTIVTHSLLVLFATIFLIIVVGTLNQLRNTYEEFVLDLTAKHLCELVRSTIEDMYSPTPSNMRALVNESMGKISLRLPDKVGGMKYKILLLEREIKVIVSDREKASCSIALDVILEGKSAGGDSNLEWIDAMGNHTFVLSSA